MKKVIRWWMVNIMPTFVIMLERSALKTAPGSVLWVKDARQANTYTSKYQAKCHLKQLDNVPDGVKIVELVENENGDNSYEI